MNNDGITITTDELRNAASEMRSKIVSMKDNLNIATNEMEKTKDYFESESANTLRSKYSELKSKFDSFYEEMESYAEFLDNTASQWDQTDQNISKAGNDILES